MVSKPHEVQSGDLEKDRTHKIISTKSSGCQDIVIVKQKLVMIHEGG